MHLLLIRHGETDWNNEGRMQGSIDMPLNARGIEQAGKLAARLVAEEQIEVLYTSPLARARVTAEIIGQAFRLAPIPDPRLVERSIGKLEGLTLQEVETLYPKVYRAWREDTARVVFPEGEDQVEFQQRVLSFLDTIRSRPERQVAVVTHGGTLSMFLATLIGLDIQKRFPFRFDNTSLSKVNLTRRQPRVELLNDTCHLRPAIPELPRTQCEKPIVAEAVSLDPALSTDVAVSPETE